jgi:hypothetical protein
VPLLADLVARYAVRGLLVDTNVLLLYLVGLLDPELIERFKRTRSSGYGAEDFVLVSNLIALFARIVITPHILAELSNLSLQMEQPRLSAYFGRAVEALRHVTEEPVCKDRMLSSEWLDLLPKIGFTDLSILEAGQRGKYLVLTDDLKAAAYLSRAGLDVINLNVLRGELWQAQ